VRGRRKSELEIERRVQGTCPLEVGVRGRRKSELEVERRGVTIRGRCEMEEGALRHDVAAHRYVVVTCGGRDFTTRGRREEESGDDK
jgi:hypothetical protein